MPPERWRQINQLFNAAVALAPDERVAFLSTACAGDASLRAEVEALLSADEDGEELMAHSVGAVAADLLTAEKLRGTAVTIPLAHQAPTERRIGSYQILRELGRGGMGEVYLAQDTRLGRRIALKLLPAQFTHEPERVRRFIREARAASSLNHPSIVTIHDFGEQDGCYFIATEYIEGRTLRAALKEGLTLAQSLDIATQIASALAAAHSAGIIHRDIKPENVMLRPDGYVKVLDFGLAKLTERSGDSDDAATNVSSSNLGSDLRFETKTGVIIGTIGYMSPEHARGQKLDARTDVFSLGVMLYEMIAGRHPFAAKTHGDLLAAILREEPAPIAERAPDAPPALQSILDRALAKECAARYASAAELLADLKRLRDGRATVDPAPATGDPRNAVTTGEGRGRTTGADSQAGTGKRRRVGRIALLVGALVMLAGLGLAVAYWLKLSGSRRQPFAQLRTTRFAAAGEFLGGSLSPDGRYVVYAAQRQDGKIDILVRQVVGGGQVSVAQFDEQTAIWCQEFAPDSNQVYYAAASAGQPPAIYQVPALGGAAPRRVPIKPDVFHGQSFSPDGRRMIMLSQTLRFDYATALKLVNLDGSGEQTFATFGDNKVEGAAWSPDGRSIAYIVRDAHASDGNHTYVAERQVAGGAERIILPRQRMPLRKPLWLPRGEGLLVQARNETVGAYQVYHLAPSGALRQLTQNTTDAGTMSVTADGRNLAITQGDYFGGLKVAALAAPRSAPDLANGIDLYGGLAWLFDGGIAFSQNTENGTHLWRVSAEGGVGQQLTDFPGIHRYPATTPDGRYIVFASTRTGSEQLWRIDSNGGHPVQLTNGGGTRPQCSPDSQWVVYENYINDQHAVWRVSIDGGAATQLLPAGFGNPTISPDGRWLACERIENQPARSSLAVFPFADGAITSSAPSKAFDLPLNGGTLRWTRDSRALLCATGHAIRLAYEIKLQPLAGGPPRTVFSSPSGAIFSFDLAADGQRIAYAGGRQVNGLYIISDIEK